MAGHVITLFMKEQGHQVTAFSRHNIDWCNCIVGDVRNSAFLKGCITSGEYDVVINAIGLLNNAAELNIADAIYANSYLPHFLSDTTESMTTRVFHMSTDCVFSGKNGSYTENDLRDGETVYDRSKALGELNDSKNLTFRNSIIGPDINENGIGLFNWFMRQRQHVSGYAKAIWTGVSTITLARAMECALRDRVTGIYHLVNNEAISKYELICLFNQYLRNGSVVIQPSDTVHVNKSLVNTRNDFNFVIPSYSDMVAEIRDWIYSHRSMYPHYDE